LYIIYLKKQYAEKGIIIMISLNGQAKINLSLDVLNRREDGYHTLQMIMQSIQLHDTINIEQISSGIEIDCNARYVPRDSSNIAYKAADSILKEFRPGGGVRINIVKRIPVAAGLAGGSADAAAVLKGVNRLYELGLSDDRLMQIGKGIGADVPYCIMGGTALAEGIGEKLTPLRQLSGIPVVLIKPRIGVPTAWVYKNLDLNSVEERPDTEMLIRAIENNDIGTVAGNMVNVLESVTVKRYPVINYIKQELIRHGAIGSIMSGSGPTVFGIFDSDGAAKKAYAKLKHTKHECYLTKII
jgi:4-diphosphocytidyl-2-C-methyl-D-erythritol kinase